MTFETNDFSRKKKSPAYKWDIFTAAVYIWGAKEDDFFGGIFKVETETLKYSEFLLWEVL